MNKDLLKLYIQTAIEAEMRRLFPELLKEELAKAGAALMSEGVRPMETTPIAPPSHLQPPPDRESLRAMMGLPSLGEMRMTTDNVIPPSATPPVSSTPRITGIPANAEQKKAQDAINRNYGDVMKKLGLT